jgi:hypothetical protein
MIESNENRDNYIHFFQFRRQRRSNIRKCIVSKLNSYSITTRKEVQHAIFDILIKADLLALLTIVNFVSLSNLSIHYMSFRIAKQFSGIYIYENCLINTKNIVSKRSHDYLTTDCWTSTNDDSFV